MASHATLNRAAFLDTLARLAPAFLYCLGVALLLRRYLRLDAFILCGVALAGLAVVVLAVWLSGRRYDAAYFRAWLDLNNDGGGRIMAGNDRVAVTRLPGLSGRYLFKRVLYPVLFLLVVALVPAPEPAERGSSAGLLRDASAIGHAIDQAAADALVSERQRQELRKQVERVRELAREDRREAAAEALAALRERLDRTVADTYDAAAETMESAAALAHELASADAAGDVQARHAAEQGLADLRAGLGYHDTMEPFPPGSPENPSGSDVTDATEGSYNSVNPNESSHGSGQTGSDYAEMLEALERHGRELAETGTGGGSAESGTAASGESDQLANSAESSRNGGTGGRAAAAAERLRTATESLAALREMGAAVAAASGTAGDGEGEAAAAGDGNTLGQSGTGHGGISRGRGDAPLVLADGTERGDRTLDYIPLTATGRSRFDGPELNRTRIGLGDDHEPEARRAATQSTVDAPLRLGAGATVVAPGPTRGRWVDAYFDAVTSQPNTLQSGEGKNR